MTDQPEALILAEKLEEAAGDYSQFDRYLGHESAAMLREQHAEIERLRAEREEEKVWRHKTLLGEAQIAFEHTDELRRLLAEIERLRRALKFIKNLTVEIDGCPASAFQTEGWMREIAREALEDKP